MTHLDPALIDAILDGTLDPAQAAPLRAHLSQDPCERCAAALEEHGISLEALLRLVEAAEGDETAPLSQLERAALWQSVEADLPVRERAPVRRAAWRMPAVAGAVIALAAALALFFRAPDLPDGVKGDPTSPAPPAVELRVVLGRQQGERVELDRRVGEGEQLERDRFLLFELEADRLAARYLFVVDAAGQATQLAPAPGALPTLQPAGSARVGSAGSWVVLDLVDMQGPLTIVAAAAVLPVDTPSEIIRPWQAGEPRAFVAYDTLTVGIAP